MGYEDMIKWNLNIKKYAPILIGVALALVIVPQLWSANTAYAEVSQKVKNAVADCERVNAGSVGEIRGCLTNKLFYPAAAFFSSNLATFMTDILIKLPAMSPAGLLSTFPASLFYAHLTFGHLNHLVG